MHSDLVVYRRDLPGGRIVMISIDERGPETVVGRLMLERRTDPARRRTGEPPVVAEVRGSTRGEVLASLRAVAESEGEVARRLDAWLAARRAAEGAAGGATQSAAAQRVRMGDGAWWSVERRHEMTRLAREDPRHPVHAPRERALYLFFHGGDGALRRAEVPPDFPERPDEATLRETWDRAEVLQ